MSVGVTNIRTVFARDEVPNIHHAFEVLEPQVDSNPIGLGGHTAGILKHHQLPYIGIPVSALNIGTP